MGQQVGISEGLHAFAQENNLFNPVKWNRKPLILSLWIAVEYQVPRLGSNNQNMQDLFEKQ